MSQIDEFRKIADKYGLATIRDHVNNYFTVTGRLADEVAIKSMMARVNRALRKDGTLHDLAGIKIKPSANARGRAAGWTLGHEPADDALGAIKVQESQEIQQLNALLGEEGKPAFELSSTITNTNRAVTRISRQSRIAQRELVGGMVSLEYERRIQAMDAAATRRLDSDHRARIDEQARLLDHLTGGGATTRGNGRSIVRRRNEDRDDEAA